MTKLFLILRKEFLERVKKRSFLLATLITPLLFPLLFLGITYLSQKDLANEKPKKMIVLDEENIVKAGQYGNIHMSLTEGSLEQAKSLLLQGDDYYALLYVAANKASGQVHAQLFSQVKLSRMEVELLQGLVNNAWQSFRLQTLNIGPEVLQALSFSVPIEQVNISVEGEEKQTNAFLTFGIGYLLSFLIYLFVFLYGSQVMQSVIEEKNSKVLELVISIVKPFELMLGKVLGIVSVGLFQVLIWIVILLVVIGFGKDLLPMGSAALASDSSSLELAQGGTSLWAMVLDLPLLTLAAAFIFYFIFGFLLYGALFAAIGSAVDTPQEAQQFIFPLTLPMILSLVGASSIVMVNPQGITSFWLSVFPLTAPVSMMARIAFDVPLWELLLSMGLLACSAMAMLWAAGRIYRVGILNTGTKPSYKTLFVWFWKG